MRRGGWRAIMATAASIVALPALLIPWVPLSLYVNYFGEFLPHMQRYTAPGDSLSFAGVALHVLEGGEVIGFHAVVIPAALRLTSLVLLALGTFTAMLHQRATGGAPRLEALALLMMTLLIASPLAWAHHYVLAMPLVLVTLLQVANSPSPGEPARYCLLGGAADSGLDQSPCAADAAPAPRGNL